MEWYDILWIVLFVAFIIIEGATQALVTIWFAVGALVAYLATLLGAPLWLQLLLFVLTSGAMLILVFPIAKKKLKSGDYKTNVDSIPGQTAVITETINFNVRGKASLQGVIWSATGDGHFEVGEKVKVLAVEGNHLVVVKLDQPPVGH